MKPKLTPTFVFEPAGIAPVERVTAEFTHDDDSGYMALIVRDGQPYAGEAYFNVALGVTPKLYTKIVKAAEQALRAEQARRKAARENA